jgi:cytidylate kinase
MTVIAIDGPAGSGKSTVARLLAERLGYLYLDTGAMYRAVALLALRDGVALDDGASLAALTKAAHIHFSPGGRIVARDEDVSEDIRRPSVSAAVSEVSAHAVVRDLLVDEQRRLAEGTSVVMEGRDIGTVVFPDAAVKVFLTARPQTRAERRRKELIAKGEHTSAAETLAAIEARDAYDCNRSIAPLRRAASATEIDTSEMTIDQVVATLEALVAQTTLAGC